MRIFSWLGILLLFSAPVMALDYADKVVHNHGLLWEVSKKGLPKSYLFGTMHSDDPKVMALLQRLGAAMNEVKTVCTELPINRDDNRELMYFDDGRTLKSVLGENLFHRSAKALSKVGLNPDAVDRLKPWALLVKLSRPDTGPVILDVAIANQALAMGKRTCGLELISEQINTFAGIPRADQIQLIEEALAMFSRLPDMHAQLRQAYLKQDLASLVSLSRRFGNEKNRALMERYLSRLVDERNEVMLRRMLPRLRRGPVLVAVGALHLPGRNGLLSLLEVEGFKVLPVF